MSMSDRLECYGVIVPAHILKKYYHVKPHPATELVAFRTGSYTAKLCAECARSHFNDRYPGGPWWTWVGNCTVCDIAVHYNPSMTLHFTRHPAPIICSSRCGQAPKTDRAATRAEQQALLFAEQAIEARRQERRRTDQLIEESWPEMEAYK